LLFGAVVLVYRLTNAACAHVVAAVGRIVENARALITASQSWVLASIFPFMLQKSFSHYFAASGKTLPSEL